MLVIKPPTSSPQEKGRIEIEELVTKLLQRCAGRVYASAPAPWKAASTKQEAVEVDISADAMKVLQGKQLRIFDGHLQNAA